MTGLYVRVKTDEGKWDSKDIAELTDNEMDGFIASQCSENYTDHQRRPWLWVKALAAWIRNNVKEQP